MLDQVNAAQKKVIENAKFINLVLDGWTDVSGIYYVAVILVIGGDCEYIGNLRFGEGKQDAVSIAHAMDVLIKETFSSPPNDAVSEDDESSDDEVEVWKKSSVYKIVAVISDSAAVMKLSKTIFRQTYPAVVSVPCVLHILNLISKDAINSDSMEPIFKGVCSVSTFFRRSHVWSKKLKSLATAANVPCSIKSYSQTRWFSFVEMYKSVAEKEKWFNLTFGNNPEGIKNQRQLPSHVREFISDRNNFTNLAQIVELFDSIKKHIQFLESDQASLCDVWPQLLTMFKYFENAFCDYEPPFDMIIHDIITSMNKRMHVLQQDIFVIAFFLNPAYREIAISRKFDEREIRSMIGEYALSLSFCYEECVSLVKEIRKYINGEPPFDLKEVDAVKFWKSMPYNTTLKTLALRVCSIIPHSASCERLFSRMTLNDIKNKW